MKVHFAGVIGEEREFLIRRLKGHRLFSFIYIWENARGNHAFGGYGADKDFFKIVKAIKRRTK